VNIVKRDYQRTRFNIRQSGRNVSGQLLSGDAGLANKELVVDGAVEDVVVTNETGHFNFTMRDGRSQATVRFQGTNFRESADTYYSGSEVTVRSIGGLIASVNYPLTYLSALISNALLYVEWFVLGLFLLGWKAYKPDD
jgi:hypothetical protein